MLQTCLQERPPKSVLTFPFLPPDRTGCNAMRYYSEEHESAARLSSRLQMSSAQRSSVGARWSALRSKVVAVASRSATGAVFRWCLCQASRLPTAGLWNPNFSAPGAEKQQRSREPPRAIPSVVVASTSARSACACVCGMWWPVLLTACCGQESDSSPERDLLWPRG